MKLNYYVLHFNGQDLNILHLHTDFEKSVRKSTFNIYLNYQVS